MTRFENALGSLGRALEHHVIEQVGKSGVALRLAPEAGAVADAQPERVCGMVFRHHDGEPVCELLHTGGNLPLLPRGRQGDAASEHQAQP